MSNIIFCRINACLSLQIHISVQHIWYTEYHSFQSCILIDSTQTQKFWSISTTKKT